MTSGTGLLYSHLQPLRRLFRPGEVGQRSERRTDLQRSEAKAVAFALLFGLQDRGKLFWVTARKFTKARLLVFTVAPT